MKNLRAYARLSVAYLAMAGAVLGPTMASVAYATDGPSGSRPTPGPTPEQIAAAKAAAAIGAGNPIGAAGTVLVLTPPVNTGGNR